ncbi:hypothetical protein ACJMK2_015795 [Sinanodonta woodiana]|uniref:Uncharacterized protein n=1 Tax=Sinanodonta woodiana TaxID=1069815 RepID=A0ABD3UV73_SINWO
MGQIISASRIRIWQPAALMCIMVIIFLIYLQLTVPIRVMTPTLKSIIPVSRHLNRSKHSKDWFLSTCVNQDQLLSLENLPTVLGIWKQSQDEECKHVYEVFTGIFSVQYNPAKIIIPSSFESKVRNWLGRSEKVFQESKNQSVIFVYNEFTREQNAYNPIRGKRPLPIPEEPERLYVDRLAKNTASTCDFCQYEKFTAEEPFGRIISNYSATAANTFKLDTWHSLVLTRTHHPLNWTMVQFADLYNTAQKWFFRAHIENAEYKFPSLIWDLLPHAGASQIHPHLHVFLDRVRYQGAMENWRTAAREYAQKNKRDFFQDMIDLHAMLGLSVQYGKAIAFANLVPKKENEIVVISEEPNEDFSKLLYFVLRAFIDDMQLLCFSSGVAYPSLDSGKDEDRIPVFARLVTRGAVAEIRSDVSSLELFAATNANTDPFEVIRVIQKSVEKRSQMTK